MTREVRSPPALAVEGVSHAYGARKALDRVSFTAPAGAFTVLLGLNGAGKTTLFSLVTRLYAAREGAIRVHGIDVAKDPPAALARLGVVFQARTLDLDLSVRQNLTYHGALHGLPRAEAWERGRAELARVGLAERVGDKARALSGGQMRRVEIARALIHRPSLLLLDEPTVGLDVKARGEILANVRRLVAEDGVGVLWATHLMDEVGADDRVVVLHEGEKRGEGSVADIVAETGARDIAGAFAALTERARVS